MWEPVPYDRRAAVRYAHRWAYGRNPAYYDYEEVGGDCTSFASQCLYAGIGVMDYTPEYGWYYLDANNKAPAWTGVEFLYRYLTQTQARPGPYAVETGLDLLLPGDIVQLSPQGDVFTHTAVVVQVGSRPTLRNTLVAAHSYDVDRKPLGNYAFRAVRYLHILGGLREAGGGS